MRRVFADTAYWIALVNVKDDWRKAAWELSQSLTAVQLVTTDMVLAELLNYFAEKGQYLRDQAVRMVDRISQDTQVEVVPQTRESFASGFDLYRKRPDKGYSLTDCVSMKTMERLQITDVLTPDAHFAQERFRALMLDKF